VPVRALWVKAPFVLRRHPALLASVLFAAALAGLAAASLPLVRAGVESESLRGQLRSLTPLAAGLEVTVPSGDRKGDRDRRAAAVRFGADVPALGPPVMSSLLPAQLAGPAGAGVEVVALTRTGAVAHVRHEARSAGDGVWISDSTARAGHLHPGSILRLTEHVFFERPSIVRLRVAGIYRSLETDTGNPYWANWLQDIRAIDPDSTPPPSFVLMSVADFERTAARLSRTVENRFEYPVDVRGLTLARAERLNRRLESLAAEADRVGPLGCGPHTCTTTSALSAALTVASRDVAAVSPTVALLSAFGVLIALAAGFSGGIFLVRRRADEVQALYTRGEGPLTFAARVLLESILPGILACAIGIGAALRALRAIAPGATDSGTVRAAALWAVLASAGALGLVAVGSATVFPRDPLARTFVRRVSGVPWELVPLGLAAGVLALLLADRGLTHDAAGATHPRLAVFVLPLVAVPGVAGLAARAARRSIRGSGDTAPAPLYLAVRRLTAARGLLLTVVAASATAFGTFAYTSALSASLSRTTVEKGWVANGSDVQGLVDPHATVTGRLGFPVAVVEVDSANVSFASGERVDLIAGDPAALARTLRWGGGWADDPRALLPRLTGDGLAAIATPGAPEETAVIDQGVRLPVRIVGHAAVPGATAGRPALLVSRSELRRFARRDHILDPAPQAQGLVWAKGPPGPVERALAASPLTPVFMTTPAHILDDPSVRAAARSYRFVKVIGGAAAGLSVLCLLTYLQARRRSQLIATAILRRMGLGSFADAGALAIEASLIVLFAGAIGGAIAIACARAVAPHVDSLPQYAPGPVFVVPWLVVAAGLLGTVIVAAVLAAATAVSTTRAAIAEALRVA
jgi:hypothetical protein